MLQLPATCADVYKGVVEIAIISLPPEMDTEPAEIELLAIGQQETGFRTRQQDGGPAHGLWQFELNGVKAVMSHPRTKQWAQQICQLRGVVFEPTAVYTALLTDDILACVFARLLLWSSPKPLAPVGDMFGAWKVYVDNWNPGKPSYERWKQSYQMALEAKEWQSYSGSKTDSSQRQGTSGNGEQSTSSQPSWLSQLSGLIRAICKLFFRRG